MQSWDSDPGLLGPKVCGLFIKLRSSVDAGCWDTEMQDTGSCRTGAHVVPEEGEA